jgi:hypothetical protein
VLLLCAGLQFVPLLLCVGLFQLGTVRIHLGEELGGDSTSRCGKSVGDSLPIGHEVFQAKPALGLGERLATGCLASEKAENAGDGIPLLRRELREVLAKLLGLCLGRLAGIGGELGSCAGSIVVRLHEKVLLS